MLENRKFENVLSYVEITSAKKYNSPPKNTPGQTLLVIPRSQQETLTTTKDLYKNINLSKLKIGINSVKNIKNGGIEIKCKSKEDIQKLEKEIKEKTNHYNVEVKKLLNPKIKLSGLKLENEISEIDLQNMIRQQNYFIQEDDILLVNHLRYNERKKSYMLFAEINAKLFKKIFNENNGKLFVGWQYINVYENNQVTRCYNCCRYNHKSKNCQNKTVCPHCTGEHLGQNCKNQEQEKRCINCEFANAKYRTKYCTKHMANDNECPTFQYYQKRLTSQINYA